MSITLDLPPELKNELVAEAVRLNLPLSEYAVRVLATGRIAGDVAGTGAELAACWQGEGVIGSRSNITDSQAHSRKLRQDAQTRTR